MNYELPPRTRCFVKLVTVNRDWGINLLLFRLEGGVEQHAHPGGEQSAECTHFRFDRKSGKLDFVVNGQIETCEAMREIDRALAGVLIRPDNWDRLCQGLHNKSPRTLAWLRQKGIA